MRLKAQIWIKAYIRICASNGLPAAVIRHGDDDAGAIYIRINRLDGTSCLFGPAPAGLDGLDLDRSWVPCLDAKGASDATVDDYLERTAGFDPDIWIVEVESRSGVHHLDPWLKA